MTGVASTRTRLAVTAPEAVAFWRPDRGLVGTGTVRPCSGAVLLTRDGGRTFHALVRTRGPVEWVATAGRRDAWALVERCTPIRVSGGVGLPYRLMRTLDGGRSWRLLPAGEGFNPSFVTRDRGIAVAAAVAPPGHIGLNRGAGLLTTSDGGRSWHPLPEPRGCHGNQGETLSWPARRVAWVLCVGEPGAGAGAKRLVASTDGGRSWHTLVNVALNARHPVSGIPAIGDPLGLTFSPTGFGLLWENRGWLYLSHDGGHRWVPTAVLQPDIDHGLSAAVLSRRAAFFLRHGQRNIDLLRTLDGGRTWGVVHRWPAK